MVTDIILHKGGKRNAYTPRHMFKILKIFYNLLKGPDPSYLVFKFSNMLPINNWDVAQNVFCDNHDIERSRVTGQNK